MKVGTIHIHLPAPSQSNHTPPQGGTMIYNDTIWTRCSTHKRELSVLFNTDIILKNYHNEYFLYHYNLKAGKFCVILFIDNILYDIAPISRTDPILHQPHNRQHNPDDKDDFKPVPFFGFLQVLLRCLLQNTYPRR